MGLRTRVAAWVCRDIKLPTLGVPAMTRPKINLQVLYRLSDIIHLGESSSYTFRLNPQPRGQKKLELPKEVKIICSPGNEWSFLERRLNLG